MSGARYTLNISLGKVLNGTDEDLAALWQLIPGSGSGDKADELLDHVVHEIARRWVRRTNTEYYYWSELCRLAMYRTGEWVQREVCPACGDFCYSDGYCVSCGVVAATSEVTA